jgi:hypothetical protein
MVVRIMSDATVTMPLDELLAQRETLSTMEKKIVDLQQQLLNAKFEDPSQRVAGLHALARAMLPVVQFAMANCSPRDIKRWPWRELKLVADLLDDLPDYTTFDSELADEMVKFAAECEEWDIRRKNEPEKEIPPPFPVEDHPIVRMIAGKTPIEHSPAEMPELPKDLGSQLPGSSGAEADQLAQLTSVAGISKASDVAVTKSNEDPSSLEVKIK